MYLKCIFILHDRNNDRRCIFYMKSLSYGRKVGKKTPSPERLEVGWGPPRLELEIFRTGIIAINWPK